jgi:hypothetical protein
MCSEEEPGEVQCPVTAGQIAYAICVGALAACGVMGCAMVTAACAGVSSITVGGMVVPCVYAVPAGCAGSAGLAAAAATFCPHPHH